MKTKLFTKNLFLGLLVAFVLMWGVQGVCEALTLTPRSATIMEKGEDDPDFEISFSVGLKSDTTAIRNNERKLIKDSTSTNGAGARIDSQGYLVTEINGTDYRTTTISANTAGLGDPPSMPTGYTRAYAVYAKRPSPYNDYQAYSSDIVANSSRNAFSSNNGYPLYYHIPALDGNSDNDTTDPGEAARTTSQIRIRSDQFTSPVEKSNRYHYNDEAIAINVAPSTGMTVRLKSGSTSYPVTILSANQGRADFVIDNTKASLWEGGGIRGLPSSITLICKSSAEGVYTVTIRDVTPAADFPANAPETLEQETETFTLRVTEGRNTTVYTIMALNPSGGGTSPYLRVDTGKTLETIHDDFEIQQNNSDLTGDHNPELRYKIISGNGTLFAAADSKAPPYSGPNQDITVHYAAKVFLNTNKTTNEVSVSVAGRDRQTHPATIVYEYSGSDRRTTQPREQPEPREQPTQRQTPTLSIAVAAGDTATTRRVTVTATNAQGAADPGRAIRLTSLTSGFTLSETAISGTPLTITVPTTPGDYRIQAGATGYNPVESTITVRRIAPGTLTLRADAARVGTQQQIRVTASGRTIPSAGLVVTIHGGAFTDSVTIPSGSTSAPKLITLPTATSPHTLYAAAGGYNNSASLTIPAPGQQQTTGQQTTTGQQQPAQQTARGTPDEVQIRSEAFPSGTVNTQLAQPLVVRVLDANGNGVRNVRVTFTVTSGRGRLQQRGSGQSRRTQTDASGDARTPYTPISAKSTVEAKAAGVSQTVTFTITTGATATRATSTTAGQRRYAVRDEIPLSPDGMLRFRGQRIQNGTAYTCVGSGECVISYGILTKGEIQAAPVVKDEVKTYKVRDEIPLSPNGVLRFTGQHTQNGKIYTCVGSGECVISYGILTKGVIEVSAAPVRSTGGTPIQPEVHLAVASRPPMLWVGGGSLYALVGKSVQKFAPSVSNAQNITVAADKVYWTEKTGERGGTINRSNLDGTGITKITSIFATPTGIAVDAARGRIYVTNTGGRILSMNLDGSRIQTVLQNLSNPKDLAVSGGIAYWTQGTGGVRFVNLSGTKNVLSISNGADAKTGSLVISGNKVYWTEQPGESGGTINSANLNGTGVTRVASILAGPTGIAVDAARGRIYVTNTGGRILSMNLDGSRIQTVADGLGGPGDMVISNSIKAPAAEPAKTTTPTTASKSKYDLNGDGTVDNQDVAVILLAVSAGTTLPQHDVNGDGAVDIKDVMAVNSNLDKGAASAPTLLGRKFTALEVDRLQEQIDLLIATGDRSPAAIKTLIYLQQLIALARPEKTQLLANYPNPFNPETWIPYELAEATQVKITIYNAQGVVIRTLLLGQQSAGYYTDRERAAYWDGRNALGEQVASGIYFYQLETDEMSSLRKMVILK